MDSPTGTTADHRLRIVLADDHPVVREGLKLLVNSQPDMRVVGEAGDGAGAWEAAKMFTPDVLVMDLSMPGVDGTEATERVRRDCPTVKVVVLTVHEERIYLTRLLRAGAAGYVLKRAAAADLVRALRVVAAGGTYIDPSVAALVVDGAIDSEAVADETPAPVPLSNRERDVLMRIAKGYSNKEIASSLELSVKTVETYKSRMAEKLGLRSRVDIVRYASRLGWLDEPS